MPWGLAVNFAPSILQWGANWLPVIFIPGSLLCSIVLASSWGAFILLSSPPSPCHHGGSSTPSSHSPCYHGGSSFPFSVGIMRAKAGSSHRPPVLGGSASMAIPPSVTHEVQDVSSLVATPTPLTNVRVLPLMADSHPGLLGSSRDVSGGAASPPSAPAGSHSTVSTAPAPSATAVPASAPFPIPVGPTPLPVNQFTLPPIKSGGDYLQTLT